MVSEVNLQNIPMQNEKVKLYPRVHFRIMSLKFRVRKALLPHGKILAEAGIGTGFCVLDYGCGPGAFATHLVKLVGDTGEIYALDVNPLAIQLVHKIQSRKKLKNIHTILSDCKTGLPSDSVDVVLLYDILHHLKDSDIILAELYRVLKPEGILSMSDHHMKQEEILSRMTSSGLFRLSTAGKRTYSFIKK